MVKTVEKEAVIKTKKVKAEHLPAKKVDMNYIMTNFKETNVMNFGKGLQANIANFTNTVLSQTTARELLDTTSSIVELQKAMKQTERTRTGKPTFVQKIKYFFVDKVDDIKNATGNALQVVDKVELKLKDQQQVLLEDAKSYERMQKMSNEYLHALEETIADGENKVNEAKEWLKKNMKGKSKEPEVKQAYDYVDAFEHRLSDLRVTKSLVASQIPSMEIAKRSNVVQNNKIDVIINNTIPIWKQAMVNSLYLAHSDYSAKNIKLVTDMTNQLIKDNADFSKETTKRVAIENERPIVDVETIEYSNRKMIETLTDLTQIVRQGKENRRVMIERLKKNQEDTANALEHLMEQEVGLLESK